MVTVPRPLHTAIKTITIFRSAQCLPGTRYRRRQAHAVKGSWSSPTDRREASRHSLYVAQQIVNPPAFISYQMKLQNVI
jgi:hypothetical protein